jgi:hypothetical protein
MESGGWVKVNIHLYVCMFTREGGGGIYIYVHIYMRSGGRSTYIYMCLWMVGGVGVRVGGGKYICICFYWRQGVYKGRGGEIFIDDYMERSWGGGKTRYIGF